MRFLSIFLFSCLFSAIASAQLSGTVKDELGKPVPSATMTLLRTRDSSVVKLSATDASGKYQFVPIPEGNYFIRAEHIGFATVRSAAFAVHADPVSLPGLVLNHSTKDLKEVVVTSRKPLVEVSAEKTILNVEGSINAVGTNALELLRKAPGVMLDKDDNISLSGKNGVQIFIDGRRTPMAGKDLTEFLKTIQSSEIEAIEIISNPSAKYDAAGNAGIINIRLKKNKSFGTNGNLNGSYALSNFSKYNAGISLNNRDKKVNLFGSYNYNNSVNESYINLHREQLDTLFDGHSVIQSKSNTSSFKAGMDVFIDKKNTFGILVNGSFTNSTLATDSKTPISYIPSGQVNRILTANNSSDGEQHNGNLNLNYRYADTSGHELGIDADYGLFHTRNDQMQPNIYLSPTGNAVLFSDIFELISPTDIDIYSLKGDYEQRFHGGKLGFGAKLSYVTSDNNFQQFGLVVPVFKYDSSHSNQFNYKENINAGYINYSKAFTGWVIQAGLRVENTHATGASHGFRTTGSSFVTYDSSFTRDYTDLFPSAAITFNKNPMGQWSLAYSRRIDRPAYQDLNPFEFKLDEYTLQKGNTQLRPQYTNSVGLTYTYHYTLNMTLNYSHVKDVFTQLVDTTEKSKAFLTKKNLATQDIISLNISYPFQAKWYSMFTNLNTYYSMYQANFGAGRVINLNVFTSALYMQHSAKLGKGWSAELSGFYNTPSIWQGTFQTQAIWSVDGGFQKTIFKGKGNLKVSVSDIFNTLNFTAVSNFSGQTLNVNGGSDSRQLRLALSYRFGNNQVKAARQRTTGADEEGKRANGQGGLIKSN